MKPILNEGIPGGEIQKGEGSQVAIANPERDTTIANPRPEERKLYRIKVVMVPYGVCVRCGQHGYVGEKSCLCLACLNIAIVLYAKRQRKSNEERSTNGQNGKTDADRERAAGSNRAKAAAASSMRTL